ncbi:MAG TPA: serine hydrolase domain-containing protein, partial [Thermoanaerobaculia bacterium]|nr:serine hydrolase domain-containing protein [Thermoanaerobaculia bacterium]
IVVERVSGKTFPEFTRERIFAPLGMTHSSWRDDFTRVVKGRATAYDPGDHGYVADMDFEDIYGNCCLLTTVGDLLRWNENFKTATVGGPRMIATMQTPGALASGQKIDYAFGLFVAEENGRREVYHSGATAGWRAFLTRRIDDDLSIAVLCNRGDASAGSLLDKVANVFVERTPPPRAAGKRDDALAGLYRDAATDAILRVTSKDDGLHLTLSRSGNGPVLSPLGENRFRLGRFNEVRVGSDGLHLITLHKAPALYVRVADANPTLAQYAGTFASDEVGVTYEAFVDGGTLAIKVSPVSTMKLEPTYADAFVTDGGDLVRFTRNAKGGIDGFDLKADYGYTDGSARVERMHFNKR